MKKVRLLVAGRVQGVGFRYTTQALAVELGIAGRVWNNDDGTVEILAQTADAQAMSQFIQTIRQGPSRFAKVTYVDVTPVAFADYTDFKVVH